MRPPRATWPPDSVFASPVAEASALALTFTVSSTTGFVSSTTMAGSVPVVVMPWAWARGRPKARATAAAT